MRRPGRAAHIRARLGPLECLRELSGWWGVYRAYAPPYVQKTGLETLMGPPGDAFGSKARFNTLYTDTALQLKHSKPPNCERIWNEKVGITLPWRAIWKMLGTFLTNPRDEEAFFKLLHRKLNTRTKDSRSTTKRCRMKCGCLETQLHLVAECPKLGFYRRYATKFLKAMGVQKEDIDPIYTWIFNLDTDLKPLNKAAQAFLRIALRTLYRHLTQLEVNGAPINKSRIKRDIANDFMSRILAYQLYRRNYYPCLLYTSDAADE